jgi:hypothetical protein
MFKSIKFLVLILFLCNFISEAEAATINAASCSRSHVQSAINSASDGDTVVVPAGTASWTNSVLDESVIVFNKGITLTGAGIGLTVITDATLNNPNDSQEALIQVSATEGKPFRITGFSFLNVNDTGIQIYGSCKDWRVDNCYMEGSATYGFYISGYTYGVIDHCEFKGGASKNFEVFVRENNDPAWARPLTLGTEKAVYVEDCTFTGRSGTGALDDMCDGDDGARLVIRYNTITNQYPHVHGNKGTGRSAFSIEIYENTIIDNGGTNCYCAMQLRGGTGVVFNNTYTGDWGGLMLRDQNSDDGACGSYPCPDQIGRTTGQALEPVYGWNNKENGVSMNFSLHCGACSNVIRSGRDYHNNTQKPGYTPYAYPHPLITGEDPPPSDTTPPSDITSVKDGTGNDIDSTSLATELSANWTPSTDGESGISKYWYAIGDTPGSTSVVGWTSTSNGTVTSVTRTGLILTVGKTYYFSVKAVNGTGLGSNATNSDGQLVGTGGGTSPGEDEIGAKVYPNPYTYSEGNPVTFSVNETTGGEVKIYTISGKLVKKLLIAIKSGLYIYSITDSERNKKTDKLLITQ